MGATKNVCKGMKEIPPPPIWLPVLTTITLRVSLLEKEVDSRFVVKAAEEYKYNFCAIYDKSSSANHRIRQAPSKCILPASFPGSKVAKVFFCFDFLLLSGHESICMPDLLSYVLEVLFHNLDSFSVVS